MANGSMEVEFTRPVIQRIPSSIRNQEQCHRVPAIKITHVYDQHCIFPAKSKNEKSLKHVTFKRPSKKKALEMSKLQKCTQCNNSSVSERVPCADNCLSLMLPLEVELNVLGVVDQGMIDRGEIAKIRRSGSRKRNSAPDIFVDTLSLPTQPQKARPKSFTISSDHDLTTLLNRQSLQSTTLCSTEL